MVEKDTERNELVCEVKTSGKISDNKGCNLPSGELSVNVVTEKDAADLDYIAKYINPEYVAASFIGTGDDVKVLFCLRSCHTTTRFCSPDAAVSTISTESWQRNN